MAAKSMTRIFERSDNDDGHIYMISQHHSIKVLKRSWSNEKKLQLQKNTEQQSENLLQTSSAWPSSYEVMFLPRVCTIDDYLW